MKKFSAREIEYLERARVARLGTIDFQGRVHLIPIDFANSRNAVYFVVDKKKKKTRSRLNRLRNIERNSNATLLIGTHSEDWRNALVHDFALQGANIATIQVHEREKKDSRAFAEKVFSVSHE